jgi:hypothetical protein
MTCPHSGRLLRPGSMGTPPFASQQTRTRALIGRSPPPRIARPLPASSQARASPHVWRAERPEVEPLHKRAATRPALGGPKDRPLTRQCIREVKNCASESGLCRDAPPTLIRRRMSLICLPLRVEQERVVAGSSISSIIVDKRFIYTISTLFALSMRLPVPGGLRWQWLPGCYWGEDAKATRVTTIQ